jgi:hypothetical protein
MRVIKQGGRERRISNYRVIEGLVEGVWKKGDLEKDRVDGGKVIDWRELMEVGGCMPSFI